MRQGLIRSLLCLASAAVIVMAAPQQRRAMAANAPAGYRISVLAKVPYAREMTVCAGALYVGTRQNAVYRVPLSGGPAKVVLSGLVAPNGVTCLNGTLYVAARTRVIAFRPTQSGPLTDGVDVVTGLPDLAHHGLRYIAAGPDGRLYVSIGSPCNICKPEGLEGTIQSMKPDGSDVRRAAWGIRNSVGFDWRDGIMYFTDNGADMMGDDIPPDELNRLEPGGFYGFPYFGGTVRLTGFEDATPPQKQIPPVFAFQAHVASLGVHFYEGTMFPELKGVALVAQHGSWNRTVPVGYQVVRLKSLDGAGMGETFLSDIGRPVDIKELPDGSLVVSDDRGGRIWRISR